MTTHNTNTRKLRAEFAGTKKTSAGFRPITAYECAMKKGNIIGTTLVTLMLAPFVITSIAGAQDAPRRMVIGDVPALAEIHKVAATKTPSGFPVPRYVSLKFNKVNGRTGPSLEHPIAWQYQKRGMPMIIVAETEMWRKVRDINGDESWMRKPALSGDRTVVVLENVDMHTKPRETSRVTAIAERNALLYLEHCAESGYCKVRSKTGFKGWVPRYKLWGATNIY